MKKQETQLKELVAKKKEQNTLLEQKLLENYGKKLKILVENDLSRAETILSIKYINDELVKKSEDISEIIGKNILVISDQLAKEWGENVSKNFSETVVQSLNQILDQIRNARNEINNFVKALEKNSSNKDENLDSNVFLNDFENDENIKTEVEKNNNVDELEEFSDMEEHKDKPEKKEQKILTKTSISSRKRKE